LVLVVVSLSKVTIISLMIQSLKEKTMSEIPRYRMTNNLGELDNENGSWIKYEDHVAAMRRR